MSFYIKLVIFFSLCMYMLVGGGMYLYTGVCVHGGQGSTSGIISEKLSTLSIKDRVSLMLWDLLIHLGCLAN